MNTVGLRPITALLFALCCALARAESLADLDAIVARAESLDKFLESPYLVQEYYGALEKYYGAGKMNRTAFDKILGQLREMKEKVPALKTRLWETTGLGKEFAIETAVKTYGRRLDVAQFNAGQATRLAAWKATAGSYATDADGPQFRDRVRAVVGRLGAEIAAFEDEAKRGVEGRRDRAEFFKGLRGKPEYKELAAGLLYRKFTSEEITDKLGSGEADLTLDTFNVLRQGLRQSFVKDGIDIGPLVTFMQEEIPTLPQMLEKESEFPIETRTTKRGVVEPVGGGGKSIYRFRPIPRRLHGIWKGIPLGECVGGGIVADTTAERWATIAMKDTQLHHVEKVRTGADGAEESAYLGFVQNVPMKRGGRIVSSVDFGAHVLRNKVAIENPRTGEREMSSLYSLWLEKMTETLPAGWRGMMVGDSSAINNAGVLETVRGSSAYILGDEMGGSRRWSPLDGIAKQIVKHSPKAAYGYGGRMIFDAVAGNRLVMLDPRKRAIFEDPAAIEKVFKTAGWKEKIRLTDALRSAPWLPTATRDYLARSAHYRILTSWLDADKALQDFRKTRTWPERKKNLLPGAVMAMGSLAMATMAMNRVGGMAMGVAVGLGFITLTNPRPLVDYLRRVKDSALLLQSRYLIERQEAALVAGRPVPRGVAPSLCRVVLAAMVH